MRKYYGLFILLFSSCTWGSGAYHDVSFNFNINNVAPGRDAQFSVTAISVSSIAPFNNSCYDSGTGTPGNPYYTCQTYIVVLPVNARGESLKVLSSAVLLDTKLTGNLSYATIGELVPAMQAFGGFGKTKIGTTINNSTIVGFKTCIEQTKIKNSSTSSSVRHDCGPIEPIKTTCNITDSNAIIDFGTFSNDEKTRRANGSFRIDCSNDAFMRVKFSSNVDNIALSQDKKLSVGLKIRGSTPGNNSMESLIKVTGGGSEVFIDGELKNDNSSHAGPFSASVVAIVEIA